MSDRRIRELERRVHAGEPEAQGQLLLARVRAGVVPRAQLELAAFCGWAPGQIALGRTTPQSEAPFPIWWKRIKGITWRMAARERARGNPDPRENHWDTTDWSTIDTLWRNAALEQLVYTLTRWGKRLAVFASYHAQQQRVAELPIALLEQFYGEPLRRISCWIDNPTDQNQTRCFAAARWEPGQRHGAGPAHLAQAIMRDSEAYWALLLVESVRVAAVELDASRWDASRQAKEAILHVIREVLLDWCLMGEGSDLLDPSPHRDL